MRRVGEEIANLGATPKGNRVSSKEQVAANDQVTVNPPTMTDGEVRAAFLQMTQAITTKDQALTTQADREVVPRANLHASYS